MDNVSKFDGKAGSYSLGRSSYPEELIDFPIVIQKKSLYQDVFLPLIL